MNTLWEAMYRSLRVNAARPALAVGEDAYSYGQLGAAVARAAARLVAAGVTPGERVVLLADNGAGFPVHDLAVMALGAVKVPLNAALTAPEVAGIVARVRPRAAVVSDALRALAPDGDDVSIVDDSIDPSPGGPPLPPPDAVGPDDPAVIYFTGGTTGTPKGVVHTQASALSNLHSHLLESGITRDDRLLLTTPLAHAAGLFTQAALLRGAFVRIESGFDADRVLDRIDADRSSWLFAVPTMIYRMLDAAERRDWRPSTLRTLQYGAAPISGGQVRRALDRLGPVLQQLYAQTECPNFATVLRKEDHVRALTEPALLASAGQACVMCDVSVRDDEGQPLAAGDVGEVCLRAPYVMTGYWEDPSAATSRFHGPWLRTGDVGYLDEAGYLFLVDRRNDMIVSGGMNVYSIEVEQVLMQHPGVAMAAVIGVPHDDWGEAVHAVIVPAGAVAEESLREHCRDVLAGYKRPKSYELATDLPLTRYGKIDKKALRTPHWAGRGRSIH